MTVGIWPFCVIRGHLFRGNLKTLNPVPCALWVRGLPGPGLRLARPPRPASGQDLRRVQGHGHLADLWPPQCGGPSLQGQWAVRPASAAPLTETPAHPLGRLSWFINIICYCPAVINSSVDSFFYFCAFTPLFFRRFLPRHPPIVCQRSLCHK